MTAHRRLQLVVLLPLSGAVVACSSGDGVGLLGGPLPSAESDDPTYLAASGGAVDTSQPSASSGGVVADPAAVPPEGIDGLWTVTVTELTGQGQEILVNVSVDSFTVAHWTGFIQLVANINASAYDVYRQTAFATDSLLANHMSLVDMSFGVIPYALSGIWHLSNNPDTGHSCESKLTPTTLEAHCNEVFPPAWIGTLTDGRLEGTKTLELASVFGQLGGEWQLVFSRAGACVARFEHTTMGISCTGTGRLDGTSSLTFNGDTASGYTARGVEFSAIRVR